MIFWEIFIIISTRIALKKSNVTLGIILAISIAMVGAATVGFYGMQQIEAARSGSDINWCYNDGVQNHCFPNLRRWNMTDRI